LELVTKYHDPDEKRFPKEVITHVFFIPRDDENSFVYLSQVIKGPFADYRQTKEDKGVEEMLKIEKIKDKQTVSSTDIMLDKKIYKNLKIARAFYHRRHGIIIELDNK
jgi:hypothetical protein